MEQGITCCHIQNVEQQYTETEGLMEPDVKKWVFSVCGSRSGVGRSSTCREGDSKTDVECFAFDTDDALHGIMRLH
jgi:hypothetical protein